LYSNKMTRKDIVWIFVLFLVKPTLAQNRYGGNVDSEKIHLGFSFHYVQSDFKIIKTSDWNKNTTYGNPTAHYSPVSHGPGLGLLADVKLGKQLNLRFTPNILFADKSVKYSYFDQITTDGGGYDSVWTDVRKTVKASLVELPLVLKYKSERKRN